MRQYLWLLLAAILMIPLLLPGCGCIGYIGHIVHGSGILKTETYDLSDFEEVQIGGAFGYQISYSDSHSVSITVDDNLFEYVDIYRKQKKLIIKLKPVSIQGNITLEASIQLPQLARLNVSGATGGTISGFSSDEIIVLEVSGASEVILDEIVTHSCQFTVSGASRVTGSLTAEDADFDVSGVSRIELEGECSDLDAQVSDASTLDAATFLTGDTTIIIDGASNAIINSNGILDATLSGASRLEYMGEPSLRNINVSGASTLKKR
ncbi:MAG: DUF2807 domain-containing protein [Dehalococcoidales bacterium]